MGWFSKVVPLAVLTWAQALSVAAFELPSEDWKKMCPVIATQRDLWERQIELRPLDKIDLRYPDEKVHSDEGGLVLLMARISSQGIVVDLEVLRTSDPAFVQSSLEGLRRVRFVPVVIDEKPACVEHQFEIKFELPPAMD